MGQWPIDRCAYISWIYLFQFVFLTLAWAGFRSSLLMKMWTWNGAIVKRVIDFIITRNSSKRFPQTLTAKCIMRSIMFGAKRQYIGKRLRFWDKSRHLNYWVFWLYQYLILVHLLSEHCFHSQYFIFLIADMKPSKAWKFAVLLGPRPRSSLLFKILHNRNRAYNLMDGRYVT